jgi:endonuclease YncB( thermonuclease family)
VNDWIATADSIEIVFSGRRGYYGRQLVDIYIDGHNLSEVLIERGYGEVYE